MDLLPAPESGMAGSAQSMEVSADAARQYLTAAIGQLLEGACGMPAVEGTEVPLPPGEAAVGVLSLVGHPEWTVFLALPSGTAEDLVRRFAGFEVPFDSPDMDDATGEFANIFCGQLKAVLDQQGLVVELSLPTVLRTDAQAALRSIGEVRSFRFGCEAGDFNAGIVY